MSYDAYDKLVAERTPQWIEELREYCRIPCETAQMQDLKRGAQWTADRLRKAGCTVEVIEKDGVAPLVVGEIGSGKRTLICVQHYDVQPAAPLELWTSPPYEPTIRDGKLFARGVSDNKGQFLIRVQAVEAYRGAIGELPCKIRFLVEGEEESSSRHFNSMLQERPDLVAGDGSLQEGGSLDAQDRPMLICGVRGICYVELSLRTLSYDAHSGGASLFENAAWRLVEALVTMRKPDGTVTIDGFYDDVRRPTAKQRAHLKTLPFEEAKIKAIHGAKRFVGDRTGSDAQVAQLFNPTCNIAGIWSGWTGDDAKTITPAEAHVKIDMRLVPDQDPEKIEANLRAHLDKRGFTDIQIKNWGNEHPYWGPVDAPLVDAAARASKAVYGMEPLRTFSSPGTAPQYQVCRPHKLPMVAIGYGHPDSRAHAPDENVRLDLMPKAAMVLGRFFDEFSRT
ncbi:MAG TPA: M20/M25/M40 family metallo-hydrolase [Candidatus Limnocylindria bacterium]|nr:M20/M25/M40 family metallo-hydrolase [Candidatus Limnocylindria bacterium]